MVITTSAPAHASATVVAAAPPAALSRPTDGFATSKPVTACPPLSRFCAIGKPMLPSPMNPMRAIAVPLSSLWPDRRALLRMLARRLDREKQIACNHRALHQHDQ